MSPSRSLAGRIGAYWGALGVLALLATAVWRLTPLALAPWRDSGGLWIGVGYAASILFMAYTEGYRGFQKGFSPRVARRAVSIQQAPRPLDVLLAPAYCMALFRASRRRLIASWGLLLGIVALVLAIRRVPQPWRGMVDAGVVVGLSWGLVTTTLFVARALIFSEAPAQPERPGEGLV